MVYVKPLSVNQAWLGRKRKSAAYRQYETELLAKLPTLKVSKRVKLSVSMVVYYSNPLSDIDNFIKPFLDILQMKYGFNDKQIYKLSVLKEIVNKGSEGITFKIENLEYT
jgi:Holliday junction resolvase RusA-like endonuclease